ncbi:TlpA family protein disulfide reductase [Mucilaginibacter paludis]|uniref:Redoxin domain protein n=1 Tax=Mucilaginibacter paludis DSM 18603 TaxID=714943 RepID=H1YBL9_9SPHI|nr:TlpA family protein disulfide reductase [Mucilaginibacter paludis]EHQ25090.1 Redoxin domain protein [Mucilaginibacter paludis DSM 18603]
MKKITIYIVLAALCLNFNVLAQDKTPNIAALKIGDKVPDITINNIINYKDNGGKSTTTAKISDFKGKLLILDFWATWCSSCIVNFPKIEDLEKEFGSKLQILAVTNQNRNTINKFFASEAGHKYHITSAVNDTLLAKLFPHRLIPHCVWISQDGHVIAITSAEDVNKVNLTKAISNIESHLTVKKDLEESRPLFLSENYPFDSKLIYYSIFSKGAYSGLGSGTQFRKSNGIVYGRAFTNEVLINIYLAAARGLFEQLKDSYNSKRLLLNVADTTKVLLTKGEYGIFKTDNQYNFDLIVPIAQTDSLYTRMLRDLNRYTDYFGRIEKRDVQCLVLKRTSGVDKLKSKGGKNENTLFFKKPAHLTNFPINYLIKRLNAETSISMPVIDETNYHQMIDIQLSGSLDLDSLRADLKRYDLDLVKERRSLNMFILSDKPSLSADIKARP